MTSAAHLAAVEALDDAGYTAERLWDLECSRAASDIDKVLVPAEAARKPRKLFRTSGVDLARMQFPATPWLIRGLLKDHGLQGVAAEPKNIKTWVMMECAFAVASGAPAFGEFETCGEPGDVFIFAAEDHLRACEAKLRAIAASKNMMPERVEEVRGRFHLEALTDIDVRQKLALVELVASARTLSSNPKMMIFDPLIKVHKGKENDSTEMEEVTKNLAAIGRVLGCTIQFVHHNGKSNEAQGKRRGGQKMRGSGSLHGAVDGGLYLDPPTGNRTTEWSVRIESEIKGALSAAPFTVKLNVLKDDENGEAELISWEVEKGMKPDLESRIIGLLQANPRGLSASQMREDLEVQKSTLAAALKALCERQVIYHEGGGHSSRYLLEREEPFDD